MSENKKYFLNNGLRAHSSKVFPSATSRTEEQGRPSSGETGGECVVEWIVTAAGGGGGGWLGLTETWTIPDY